MTADIRQKSKEGELLNTLGESAWHNTPRLAAMITTTAVSMMGWCHPLLANPVAGVAIDFAAGTIAGTLAGVVYSLTEGEKIDMGDLLLVI